MCGPRIQTAGYSLLEIFHFLSTFRNCCGFYGTFWISHLTFALLTVVCVHNKAHFAHGLPVVYVCGCVCNVCMETMKGLSVQALEVYFDQLIITFNPFGFDHKRLIQCWPFNPEVHSCWWKLLERIMVEAIHAYLNEIANLSDATIKCIVQNT